MTSNPAFKSGKETCTIHNLEKEIRKGEESESQNNYDIKEVGQGEDGDDKNIDTEIQRNQNDIETRWWGARHTMGLMVFIGLMLAYMVRVSLSITIVAMVSAPKIDNTTTNSSDVCPTPDSPDEDISHEEGEFAWNSQTQGLILGSFFWGYTATNFLGGRAAEYFGSHLVVGLGVVLPSALTLLSQVCARTSKELFIVLRVLEGLTQGVVYPAVHSMFAAWIPPKDRGSFCAIVFSGASFGTVIALAVGGWLCNTQFLGGWPSVFYIFGGLGVLWGLPWFLLVHNLPEQHPTIHSSELNYITKHRTYVHSNKTMPLPVGDIAKSAPFWTLVVMAFGYNFVFYNLLTELPTYFSSIQHFDLSTNGWKSAVPYAVQFCTTVGWGAVVSALSTRNIITVGVVRKLSTSIGMYGSAVALVVMMWVECDAGLAMAVMCVAVGALGTIYSGSALSEQDIAPNFAGSIKGFTNTIGAATGFIAPAITGVIINNNQTLSAWRTVFGVAAGLSVLSCTQYIFLSTAKVQHWNTPKPNL